MTRHELTTEDRRRGAARSAEVRRKKRDRGWAEAFLELVDRNPEAFAQKLAESGNAYAIIKAIELSTAGVDFKLRQREAELKQRAQELDQRERQAQDRAEWLEWADDRIEATQAEVAALERQRDELHAAIKAEANAHELEYVEDESDALA